MFSNDNDGLANLIIFMSDTNKVIVIGVVSQSLDQGTEQEQSRSRCRATIPSN